MKNRFFKKETQQNKEELVGNKQILDVTSPKYNLQDETCDIG